MLISLFKLKQPVLTQGLIIKPRFATEFLSELSAISFQ